MGRRMLCAAVAAVLVAGVATDAMARGKRGSGGSSHHYYSSSGGSRGAPAETAPAPAAAPLPFPACPPHAPCTTSRGLRYVTDPETGVSRFLPK